MLKKIIHLCVLPALLFGLSVTLSIDGNLNIGFKHVQATDVITVNGTRYTMPGLSFSGFLYGGGSSPGGLPPAQIKNSKKVDQEDLEDYWVSLCKRDVQDGFSNCMLLVSGGTATGAFLTSACGPLAPACALIVSLGVAASTSQCNDGLSDGNFWCETQAIDN